MANKSKKHRKSKKSVDKHRDAFELMWSKFNKRVSSFFATSISRFTDSETEKTFIMNQLDYMDIGRLTEAYRLDNVAYKVASRRIADTIIEFFKNQNSLCADEKKTVEKVTDFIGHVKENYSREDKLHIMQQLNTVASICETNCEMLQKQLGKEFMEFEINNKLASTIRENLKKEDLVNQEKIVMDNITDEQLNDFFEQKSFENIREEESQKQLCSLFSKYIEKNIDTLDITNVLYVLRTLKKYDQYISDKTIDRIYNHVKKHVKDETEGGGLDDPADYCDCPPSHSDDRYDIPTEREKLLYRRVCFYRLLLDNIREPRLKSMVLKDFYLVKDTYDGEKGSRELLQQFHASNHD